MIALCGAATYAELGALMPRAGGEYVYLREAYHPAVGFMSGWVSLTAGFSAPIAAAALLFAGYLGKVVPGIEGDVAVKGVACALIVAITLLHAFDTKVGGRVQAGFTVAKVLLIVGFIVAGLTIGHGDWSHLDTRGPGLGQLGTVGGAAAFATALMYVSFAYSGWNAAAYIAGEIETPQRTLPRALLLGTGRRDGALHPAQRRVPLRGAARRHAGQGRPDQGGRRPRGARACSATRRATC